MAESEDVVSSPIWRSLSPGDKLSLVRKVLNAQSKLDTAIRTLSDYRKAEASATARQSVYGIRDFFSCFLDARFYPEQHAPGAPNRPHRIFQATDLVEYMLSFAEVADLFTLRQVNKTLRSGIDQSDLLQYRTHRTTDLNGFYKTAFQAGSQCSQLTGFTVDAISTCNTAMLGIEKPPGHFAVMLEVRFDPKYSKMAVPNRYYPYGAMFLSQPPPTEIDVFPDCCSRGNYSSTYALHQNDPLNAAMALGRLQPVGKVVSNNGLTVGHLYDAIERIREEHRICPHAIEIANHDEDGNYWPNISFGCLLKVKADDPVLNPRVAAGVMARTPPPAPNWRIWDYIDAKQKAYAAGRRIPTLAEFEASMRLDNAREALPEEPQGLDAHQMVTTYAAQWSKEQDSSRPSISWRSYDFSDFQRPTSRREDSNTTSESLSSGRVAESTVSRPLIKANARRASETSQQQTNKVTPKKAIPKVMTFHQHRRDDSKVGAERPNTAKRKKTM